MNYDEKWLQSLRQKPGYGVASSVGGGKPAVGVERLPDAEPQQNAGTKLLDSHQAKERGEGRLGVRITRCGTRLLDVDNGNGGCKPLLDAIRYAGLIPDDNPEQIEFSFAQKKVPRSEVGTIIEISRLP